MTKQQKIKQLTCAWWIGLVLIVIGSTIWGGAGAGVTMAGAGIIIGACVGLIYQGLPHGGIDDR